MARITSRQIDEFPGKLIFEFAVADDYPFVSIYYQPSPERLKQAGKNTDDVYSYQKKILEFCGYHINTATAPNHFEFPLVLHIYPINTAPNVGFLQPKYAQIECITLVGFEYGCPRTLEDVENILENLPSGFVKNYDYGLGLQKDYRFIINAIEENTNIKHLTICKKEKTHTDAPSIFNNEEVSYNLNYDEYEAIRKGIDKITHNYQSEGRIDKSIFAYNALLNISNPVQYPEKYRTYKRDAIDKFISNNDIQQADLSAADQKGIINITSKNTNTLAKHQPKALMKLYNDIELVTLENLIKKFEEMQKNKKLGEKYWQTLFSENPFILSLAFGYPIIIFSEQACVGGRTISGAGDKFTDFLVKNNFTNNSALIEIKTPSTELLLKSKYRGDYTPSSKLSGSINQLLHQRYNFQNEIVSLKRNSKTGNIESYSVNCVLIIGKTPEEDDQKKSFELFRGNSKDIEIITFDELLEKLKQLHAFLSSNGQIESNLLQPAPNKGIGKPNS